jgi:glycosyltransferase involved in cell wall biosynthesis
MTSAPQADTAQRFKGMERQSVAMRPEISILVPAKDEAENLPLFMQQAQTTFDGAAHRYEVIVVDDGSVDDTWNVLQRLAGEYSFLHPVRHGVKRGIADALRTGYLHSRGSVLVFYPADLQYKPEDIPRLVAPILAGESDIVAGYKEGKYEKAFVSGIYNRLSRNLFKVTVRDLNSVKAYRREVMDSLPNRPDWHRYMIVMAAANGFSVSEVAVPLYARNAGQSKFGIGRIPVGVLDMLAVWFELRFARKPLLLFGMMGAALFLVGVVVGVVAILYRVIGGVGFRPLVNLVETCVTVGSVFFATGLIGEMLAAQRAELSQLRSRIEDLTRERES